MLCTVYCVRYTCLLYAAYSAQCTVYCVLFPVSCVLYTYCKLYAVCCMPCTACCVSFTSYPILPSQNGNISLRGPNQTISLSTVYYIVYCQRNRFEKAALRPTQPARFSVGMFFQHNPPAGMFRPLGIWIRRLHDLAAHLDHLGHLTFA
jgi:hypothetical protein